METAAETNDAELAARARGGDREAFERLAAVHFQRVYLIAYARLLDREAAEDLAQEVFLRVHLNMKNLRQPEYFATWLTRLTRNLCVDWRRSERRKSDLLSALYQEAAGDGAVDVAPSPIESKSAELEAAGREELLGQALGQLADDERELVLLHYAEGMPQAEIARMLRVHPSTVNRRLKAALGRLRGLIEPMLRTTLGAARAPDATVARGAAVAAAVAGLSSAAHANLVAAAGKSAIGAPSLLAGIVEFFGGLKASASAAWAGFQSIGLAGKLAATGVLVGAAGTSTYYLTAPPASPRYASVRSTATGRAADSARFQDARVADIAAGMAAAEREASGYRYVLESEGGSDRRSLAYREERAFRPADLAAGTPDRLRAVLTYTRHPQREKVGETRTSIYDGRLLWNIIERPGAAPQVDPPGGDIYRFDIEELRAAGYPVRRLLQLGRPTRLDQNSATQSLYLAYEDDAEWTLQGELGAREGGPRQIELIVDKRSGFLREVRGRGDSGGAANRERFLEIEKSPVFAEKDFSYAPPPGARVVDMTRALLDALPPP